MNRLTLLITGSLTALILAGCSGLWLLWQSWETGRELEQKNYELLASLEASRIRLENFHGTGISRKKLPTLFRKKSRTACSVHRRRNGRQGRQAGTGRDIRQEICRDSI